MSKVFVLYTGGTIGMAPDDPNNPASALRPQTEEGLLRWLPPNIGELGIDWSVGRLLDENGDVLEPLDSSDVNSRHWRLMANAIARVYDDYDGFVILHGTDTMAFTTSALSFMLTNLGKPVVVTGSQLPISNPRTDGVTNFVHSLLLAGWKASGQPLIPEVVLCFADAILRGNRARKVSSTSWKGFDSPNMVPIGRIGEHIHIDTDVLLPVPDPEARPFFAQTALTDNVVDLRLFPGLRGDVLDALFAVEGLKGVVLETFGAGNGPTTDEFLDAVGRAVEQRGITVINVTQCPQGKVEAGLYEASSGLLERGVLSGLDMTCEAAVTKLMWLLSNVTPDEVGVQMQIERAGEISESLFDVRYGDGASADGDGRVVINAAPAGTFSRSDLESAILRLGEINASDQASADVHVFVNHPTAGPETPVTDPRYACSLPSRGSGIGRDITPTIRRVAEEGRDITLTFVGGSGEIHLTRVSLLLLARAQHV
jgi:L-asparaginase